MAEKLDPEFKAAWLEALESGEYEQGRRYLRQNDSFCCLGVALNVLKKMGKLKDEWVPTDVNRGYTTFTYGGSRSLPSREQMCLMHGLDPAKWSESEAPRLLYVDVGGSPRGLYGLNDDGLTFKQIAQLIREQK